MYDYIIVGAGLAGCVMAERIANVLNKKVLLIVTISSDMVSFFD